MQTRRATEPLQPKTWQLEPASTSNNGYLYYCTLCDEALVLSRREINPRKIQLVFDQKCPGCSFELDKVLGCQSSTLPPGTRLFTSLKCRHAEMLVEPGDPFNPRTNRGSALPRDTQPHITTGIKSLDRTLILKRGQFAALQGDESHTLSLLLCVRATLPAPRGLDSDVVFIDGGNLFDAHAVSRHCIMLGLRPDKVQERIHLSRAFTHHQVHSLIVEKVPSVIERYNAKLAVVSDITALFCDPDIRDKREALEVFNKSIRFLGAIAEQKNMLVLATNLKARNKKMDNTLKRTAHVSAKLTGRGAYTQLTVARHPFAPEREEAVATLDNPTLGGCTLANGAPCSFPN